MDRLAAFTLPAEALPDLPERLERLNGVWEAPPRPPGGGPIRKRAFDALAPALARQTEFNALVVQVLNGTLAERARLEAHLRDVVQAVVRYMQRVQPFVDARARLGTAHATTRAELILEAFDRRQESLARRFDGLLALRDRMEALGEEVRAVRGTLAAGAPPPEVAKAAERAAADSHYTAFENRYRGTREEIRERLAPYVELLDTSGPDRRPRLRPGRAARPPEGAGRRRPRGRGQRPGRARVPRGGPRRGARRPRGLPAGRRRRQPGGGRRDPGGRAPAAPGAAVDAGARRIARCGPAACSCSRP